MRLGSAIVCLAIFVIGCSSQSDPKDAENYGSSDAGAADATNGATDASADASDAASAVTPAFKPEMPQIMNDGGAILSAPEIVTVTWTTDTNAKTYEAFGDAIGSSDYWKPVSEYGIGAATSGLSNHVEISDAPPSTMTEDELDTFVATQVAAAPGNGWPVNTAQTEYMLYVPESMKVTSGGKNDCESTDGYHDETSTKTIPHIVYGVVLEACHGSTEVVAFSTETASHEMIEAATDPHVQSDLAWTGFDPDHLAWDLWQEQQDEVADACESNLDADYSEAAPFAYSVQRFWSNASAAAGHSPCLRAPAQSYFNSTPLDVEAISVTSTDGPGTYETKGFRIPVGTTRTVRFGFYSDGASDPWAFNVLEGDAFTTPSPSRLTISTDKTAGSNGDIANVSITVNSVGSTTGILVTAVSTRGNEPIHYMPMLVGAY